MPKCFPVLLAVGLGFLAARIGGVRDDVFKDFAHLYTGGLLGAGAAWGWHRGKWVVILAVAMSAVELVVGVKSALMP